jgi:CRP/FNR family transcriptional regulator, anaerobic regulatory protein
MVKQLIARLNSFCTMSNELCDRIRIVVKVGHYKKGEHILNEGEVCDKAGLITKGLVRFYYINEGKEITSRLMEEGLIITSWNSYYTQKPSNEFMEALEDTTFVYVEYNDTQKLYDDFPEFNKIGRLIIEHAFYLSEQRTQILRKHTAEEKYRYFIEHHPTLLQRVSLKQIASYLGMNEETLSRVRTKVHRIKY